MADAQIKEARRFKEEGNAFFKEKEYKKALHRYHSVLLYTNGLHLEGDESATNMDIATQMATTSADKVPKELSEDVRELQKSTWNNMTAVYLALDPPKNKKALEICQKILAIEPFNVKALFRCGQAQLRLGQIDEALENLKSAQTRCPSDRSISVELQKVHAALAAHKQREKEAFKRMFD
eukprot:GEMP01069070.1.p1 GENE.GEMP01069070.1~~GEMP01069070.1.p1  ORF type:complete len:204 (+),score=28.47 GEMP01069070.1:75-614(+)